MMMMSKKMCMVHKVAMCLLVVGGLNWGLSALGYNVVDMLLGAGSMLAKVVYLLVGLSAVAMLGISKCCMKGGMCGCKDEKCDHCGPEEKKAMPPAQGGMGMDKKM